MQSVDDKDYLKGINCILWIVIPFMLFYLGAFGIKYLMSDVEGKVSLRRCLIGSAILKMASHKYETTEQLESKIQSIETRYLNIKEEMPSLKEKISKRKVGKIKKTAEYLNKAGIPTEVKELQSETEEQKKEQKTLQQLLESAGLGEAKRNKRKYLK